MSTRALKFAAVGAAGFVVQLGVLWVLTSTCRWPLALATLVAVETAVLHNFAWHERWTWRLSAQAGAGTRGSRLWRFHAGNAATSLAGNVVFTTLLVEWAHLPSIAANACAVGLTSVANFALADRWVFQPRVVAAVAVAALALGTADIAHAAQPGPDTLAAWRAYVAGAESTLERRPWPAQGSAPDGRNVHITGGLIHEWRGTLLVRGTTVQALVHALEEPGLPPPAPDVLDARVLAKGPSGHLRVSMRVARSAIVTVTYDTVHDVVFAWNGPDSATSRSAAVSIRELGGTDHGFLWGLQSYWRYRQAGPDVEVDLLSLSLSRDMPAVLRPVADPVVSHIARESVQHTLDAVDRLGRALGDGRRDASIAGRPHVDTGRAEARAQPGRQ